MEPTNGTPSPSEPVGPPEQAVASPDNSENAAIQNGSSVPVSKPNHKRGLAIVGLAGLLGLLVIGGVVLALLANSSKQATIATDTSQTANKVTGDASGQDEVAPAPTAPAEEQKPETPAATPTPAPTTQKPATTAPVAPAPTPPPAPAPTPVTHTMSYTDSCYSPVNITIKQGDTINFVNNATSRNMWPASNNHPNHTIYSEFDADHGYGAGQTYSFTFNKVGAWGYHDHLRSSCQGTITVQ